MDTSDRTKFIKILGLLSSDHGGERASAAFMASKFLTKRSLTWSDVISVSGGSRNNSNGSANSWQQRQYRERPNERTGQGYGQANESALYFRKVRWLQDSAMDLMSEWEKSYVTSITTRGVPLSYKQRVVVDGLIEKAKAFGRDFS